MEQRSTITAETNVMLMHRQGPLVAVEANARCKMTAHFTKGDVCVQ